MSRVLLACVLNLEAVLAVVTEPPGVEGLDLLIVCSGTAGAPALEDTYLAGLLCAALPGPRTDAALVAEAVSQSYPTPFQRSSQVLTLPHSERPAWPMTSPFARSSRPSRLCPA